MRTSVGEVIELVNGKGALASGKLIGLDKKTATISILKSSHEKPRTHSFQLAIPFMRPSKIEWIVEKGTELGASAFLFYPADFSEKNQRNLERLHLLAISSLKQSGRLYLPSLEILAHLTDLFAKEATFFFGDPAAKNPIEISQNIIFITGPERGFSAKEEEVLLKHAKGVRLNSNVLRAETAPIAAASIIEFLNLQQR